MPLNPKSTGNTKKLQKPLLKSEIIQAQADTLSNAQAARLLNVNYATYKKYASLYGLFESHKSTGRGIPRVKYRGKDNHGILDILDGKYPNYNKKRLKIRLINGGLLPNRCGLCGFSEKRPDGKIPLVLCYLDSNANNLHLDNLQLRCYNCAYLTADIGVLLVYKNLIKNDIEEIKESISITPDIDNSLLSTEDISQLQKEMFK
jgi:hypothetical protein